MLHTMIGPLSLLALCTLCIMHASIAYPMSSSLMQEQSTSTTFFSPTHELARMGARAHVTFPLLEDDVGLLEGLVLEGRARARYEPSWAPLDGSATTSSASILTLNWGREASFLFYVDSTLHENNPHVMPTGLSSSLRGPGADRVLCDRVAWG